MKRCLKSFWAAPLFLLIAVFCCPSVYAHPGKTDSDGGHFDSNTGEYHYHHGYPAHEHRDIDGDGILDCPYAFIDNTNHDTENYHSGSSASDNLDYNDIERIPFGEDPSYSGNIPLTVDSTETEDLEAVPAWVYCVFFILAAMLVFKWLQLHREYDENNKLNATIHKLTNDNHSLKKETDELNSKIEELKHYQDELINAHKSEVSKLNASHEADIELLKRENESQIANAFHADMLTKFGSRYLYVLSGTPDGDYLDDERLPCSHSSGGNSLGNYWGEKYTFYTSTDNQKSVLTYHKRNCSHISRCMSITSINAYFLQKNPNHYRACSTCHPIVPDTLWVNRYRYLKAFLEKHTDNNDLDKKK